MKKDVILNNGVKMPPIGYGVFRMTNLEECEKAVIQAIKTGYRFIDTAAAYENETAVGKAIQYTIEKGYVSREDLFIQTKLWITDTTYEKAKEGFKRSLNRLGLDYIDLYLIHQPYHDYYGAWRALEELYEEGKVRAIGVDNFTQDRMADFIYFNKVKPAVNMIECNAYFQRENEREYLTQQNILMQAWSPLAAGKEELFHNETLCNIAKRHQKTVAQIVLRWLVHRGIVPVVKSGNPERMRENYDIFDFDLSEKEMNQISLLDTGHTYAAARDTGKAVTEFLKKATQYHI